MWVNRWVTLLVVGILAELGCIMKLTNGLCFVGATFRSTDIRERAGRARGRAAVTVRLEAASPIRVHPRPAGRGRTIISVDPGAVAAREGVEIDLETARRETPNRERMLEARDGRSVERMLERLRVSEKFLNKYYAVTLMYKCVTGRV